MSQIKLNLSRLSIAEKTALGRQIVASMTGNPQFPTPHPPLTELTTAFDELEQASSDVQAARQVSKTKTSIQNTKEDAVDKLLSQSAGYVSSIAGGDDAIILSAGMGVRAAAVTS